MRNFLILLLLFVSSFSFAQKSKKIDLDLIKKETKSEKSPYNYEKLLFKYKGLPKSLDSIEAQYLYYGRNFVSEKISVTDDDFKNLLDSFKEKDFTKAAELGESLFQKDPTNLDILMILLQSYDALKDERNFVHHLTQFRLLGDAMKSSGDGKSQKTAYIVNSVGDEYTLVSILNLGKDATRSSKPTKDGMFDIWRKDGATIYIKVLYLNFKF